MGPSSNGLLICCFCRVPNPETYQMRKRMATSKDWDAVSVFFVDCFCFSRKRRLGFLPHLSLIKLYLFLSPVGAAAWRSPANVSRNSPFLCPERTEAPSDIRIDVFMRVMSQAISLVDNTTGRMSQRILVVAGCRQASFDGRLMEFCVLRKPRRQLLQDVLGDFELVPGWFPTLFQDALGDFVFCKNHDNNFCGMS